MMKRYSPLLLSFFAVQSAYALPKGFVYLNQVAPQVIEELRYGTKENFMGRPVPGYLANRCILTLPAAQQLAKAEKAALAMDIPLRFMIATAHKKQSMHFIRGAKIQATKK
ncbi:D-alanyl-D-alanine dipeptidase [Legionella hackeliae]|nr:D-alanyl-D-alanine dipeptidase [Legionella hackeliae]